MVYTEKKKQQQSLYFKKNLLWNVIENIPVFYR